MRGLLLLQKKCLKPALYAYAGVYPITLFFLLERLNPVSSAMGQNIGALAASVLIIFLFAVFLYSLIGNVFASYAFVTFFFVFVYIINHFKLMVTGGVFVPSDLRLAGSALAMINRDLIVIELSLILWAMLVLVLLAPLYFCKLKIGFRKRIVALPTSCVLFAFVLFLVNVSGMTAGRTFARYRDSGLIVGFYSEMVYRGTYEFLDIAPHEITEVFSAPLEILTVREESPNLPINPNVIVVMSEAFFDVTVLPNIVFSQNPVPNFHSLASSHMSGNLVVPTFGGGTANTEFEFLGGSPHIFFGTRWYVPFENFGRYFYDDITTTLPWMYRQNGYRTVGVHTFRGDFFNRNQIYPRIGFDLFLSADDMPNAVYRGDFIADEYFTDRIIEQIILAEEAGEPLFLFGISMQNHWPYVESRYDEVDISSYSPYLNREELGIVDTFVQGIFDADAQLGRLIDFVESRETPTIIVFFGDHLPIMGTHEHRIFEKLGFLSIQDAWEWNLQDFQNAYMSHYLVWANFEHEQECFGTVSAFLLGALVAEASGIQLNRYFTYLLGAATYLRVLTNELFMEAGGEMDCGFLNRQNSDVVMLESLWHHKMFGRSEFSDSLAELVQ